MIAESAIFDCAIRRDARARRNRRARRGLASAARARARFVTERRAALGAVPGLTDELGERFAPSPTSTSAATPSSSRAREVFRVCVAASPRASPRGRPRASSPIGCRSWSTYSLHDVRHLRRSGLFLLAPPNALYEAGGEDQARRSARPLDPNV